MDAQHQGRLPGSKGNVVMNSPSNPSSEQLEALRQYAAYHGRSWKSKLSIMWSTGDYIPAELDAPLQQIRNAFGPRWLYRQKLV